MFYWSLIIEALFTAIIMPKIMRKTGAITAPYTYSFTFHEIYVPASRYFVGDNDDKFNF